MRSDSQNRCIQFNTNGKYYLGAGIAQVAAQHGYKVTLCDVSEKALDNGRAIMQKSLARVAKKAHPSDEAAQKALVAQVFDAVRLVNARFLGAVGGVPARSTSSASSHPDWSLQNILIDDVHLFISPL